MGSDDQRLAFDLAHALWAAGDDTYTDLLAATVPHSALSPLCGAAFSAELDISAIDHAFKLRRFDEALRTLDTLACTRPDERFRAAYWRRQCLRHIGKWADAVHAFRVAQEAPDSLLHAWVGFRLVDLRATHDLGRRVLRARLVAARRTHRRAASGVVSCLI
jgi:hypothetical protein